MRSTNAVALLVLLAAPLAAQRYSAVDSNDEWLDNCRRGGNSDDRGRACEIREVAVKSNGRSLDVDGRTNGSIRVLAWDRSEVKVTARLQASSRRDAEARDLLKDIVIKGDDARITADGPRMSSSDRGDRDSWSVSYVIMVPKRYDLRLEGSNGSLGVTGVSGRLDLRTVNGSLNLTDVGGDVHARTSNGSLNVQLDGSKWEGAGLEAETQNGFVRMQIPERYAARIETETVNGRVNTDFPVTVQGRIGRNLSFPLNGGGATLRATTVNGSVTLTRR